METNSLLHNFACRERHTTLSKDKGQAASCYRVFTVNR